MRFRYTINAEDMFRFTMYHVYHSRACFVALAVPVLGCIGAAVSFSQGEMKRGLFYLIAGLAFGGIYHLDLWLRSRRQAKLNASFSEDLIMELDEEGMTAIQGEESVKVPWGDIHNLKKTGHLILVYTDSIHSYLIPKERLEADTPEEGAAEVTWESVYEYIRRHVGR